MLASVVLLSACAGTDGIVPRTTLLDGDKVEAGDAVRAALTDAEWPSDGWWSRWGDPQLDRLVAMAVTGNPKIEIAQARLDQAQGAARVAGASTLPTVSANGTFSRTHFSALANPSPPGGSTVWNNSVQLDFAYDLDLWGKNRATLEGSLDAVHASAADLREARLLIETSVVRAYIALSGQYALHDNANATLAREQGIYDITEQRYRVGLASQLELSQARTPIAATRARIAQIEQQIALTQDQLAALVGQGPAASERIRRPTLRLDVPVALPAALPAELVGHRPDVVSQRWRVEAAAKGIKAARADFYPNIDLVASAGLASAAFGGFFAFAGHEAGSHSIGAAVSLPIFDGGRRTGRYGIAVSNYDLAVATYNETVLAAFRGVADQVVSLRSLAVQQVESEASLQSAQQAFDYAERGYRSGVSDYLTVLVTQTQLLGAQQSLALVHTARLDAWAQLMMALGGGAGSDAPPSAVNASP